MSGSGATTKGHGYAYDFFISHASEDKDAVARPLSDELERRGHRVWLDEHQLKVGDPLASGIDAGLSDSRFAVVLVSKYFLRKYWPRSELDGLHALEAAMGEKRILPVWHGLSARKVAKSAPLLAGRLAANTADGIPAVADRLEDALRAPPGLWPGGAGGRTPAQAPPARVPAVPVLIVCGLAAVLTGVAGARVRAGDEPAPSLAPALSPTLKVGYPPGWRELDASSVVPALPLRDRVVVAPASPPDARLTVGISDAVGPSLLPPAFAGRRGLRRLRPSSVGALHARRFVTGAGAPPLLVLAAPTTLGVVTATCEAPRADASRFFRLCQSVAQTVELKRGRGLGLGPDRNYAKRLSAALRDLSDRRAGERRRLRVATTAQRQERAAGRLRSAFAEAARRLRGGTVSPADRGLRDRLVAALEAAAGAYRRLRQAAQQSDVAAFRRALRVVRLAEQRIRAARGDHVNGGYMIKP